MLVRRARPEDARRIAEIHVRSWQVAYRGIVVQDHLDALSVDDREHAWQRRLSNQTTQVWVCEDDETVTGWISVGQSRDDDADTTTAEIWAIYVDPTRWRRGAGRRLWAEARRHLRSAGYQQVTLWVLERNTDALAFYAALDFAPDPEHRKKVDHGNAHLTEIRLRHHLQRTWISY